MKKARKRHVSPETITLDGLRSYRAAICGAWLREKRMVRRWANNRVKNSPLPLRRWERASLRSGNKEPAELRSPSMPAFHNHFAHEGHLVERQTWKARRSATFAEWQSLMA